MRPQNRQNNQLRDIKITPDFLEYPLASVLIECGNTKILCCASVDENVPKWMKGTAKGWVSAEYSMLPYSAKDRMQRESSAGKIGGRTQEIQRLIGRSFRPVVDLSAIGERTIWVDCDVLQADGGTRTASITCGFTALAIAVNRLIADGRLTANPLNDRVAAVSVGMVDGQMVLDLEYIEDSNAQVDMNVVMTESGKLIEVQGTGEEKPFSKTKCIEMIDLAHHGIKQLLEIQHEAINKAKPKF